MISGSIGLRSPGCPLAGDAIKDLSSMVELFQKGKEIRCGRATIALVSRPVLRRGIRGGLTRVSSVAVLRSFEGESAQRLRQGGAKLIDR